MKKDSNKKPSGVLFSPFHDYQYFGMHTFTPINVIDPINLENITEDDESTEGFMYQIESPFSSQLPS